MLKDLTAEVNRLKAECTVLSEESREVGFSFTFSFLNFVGPHSHLPLVANVVFLLHSACAGEK